MFRSGLLYSGDCNEGKRTCFCDCIQSPKHGHCSHFELHRLVRNTVLGKVCTDLLINLTDLEYLRVINSKDNIDIVFESVHHCRVMGAMVIIIGLYMVLWGKSKDHPSQTYSEAADDKVATTV